MKIVKGRYENGKVTLLEEVSDIKNKKVLVTFFDEDEINSEEEALRRMTVQEDSEFIKSYLTDPREDLYNDYK